PARIGEARRANRHRPQPRAIDRAGHERERAAGDAAAARLFARVRGVEDRHARAEAREPIRGPRARRSRAHDGHIHRDTLTRQRIRMVDVDNGLFTIAVFQDASWAAKGLSALKQAGFPREALSILAKDSADATTLIDRVLGAAGERLEVAVVGGLVARGR